MDILQFCSAKWFGTGFIMEISRGLDFTKSIAFWPQLMGSHQKGVNFYVQGGVCNLNVHLPPILGLSDHKGTKVNGQSIN